MHILFVHGMGRTPLSGAPILVRLKMGGHQVSVFGYSTALNAFDSIRDRLHKRIIDIARAGDYAVIGHSLGGVLLRSALSKLPQGVDQPKHLFLLGSPMRSARLAKGLRSRLLFRAMAGDCGQLLASDQRMSLIGSASTNTTVIIGTRGFQGARSPFKSELNDGVVAESEVRANWAPDEVFVPVIHTLLPASALVAEIILERLATGPNQSSNRTRPHAARSGYLHR
jgi:pimeloyl-ACP methyl ester carboxylesterase